MKEISQQHKFMIVIVLMNICLVQTVNALGTSPSSLDLTVDKGKETEFSKYILVANSDTKPLHVISSVSGSISEFITVEPSEFDLPAGPGAHSTEASPYEYVKITFTIPREVSESKYTGEVVFTEQPTQGDMISTAVQMGVNINLNIGTVAQAEFPIYVTVMMIVLIILIIFSIVKQQKSVSNE